MCLGKVDLIGPFCFLYYEFVPCDLSRPVIQKPTFLRNHVMYAHWFALREWGLCSVRKSYVCTRTVRRKFKLARFYFYEEGQEYSHVKFIIRLEIGVFIIVVCL